MIDGRGYPAPSLKRARTSLIDVRLFPCAHLETSFVEDAVVVLKRKERSVTAGACGSVQPKLERSAALRKSLVGSTALQQGTPVGHELGQDRCWRVGNGDLGSTREGFTPNTLGPESLDKLPQLAPGGHSAALCQVLTHAPQQMPYTCCGIAQFRSSGSELFDHVTRVDAVAVMVLGCDDDNGAGSTSASSGSLTRSRFSPNKTADAAAS
jgi:hypothetical protein